MYPKIIRLASCLAVVAGCGDNIHKGSSDAKVEDGAGSADAMVDATPCIPSTTKLTALTSGDLVLDATQQENTAPISVSLASSVLFLSLRENEPSPKFGGIYCVLHEVDVPVGSPAGVTCSRNNAGTDTGTGIITVHWTVATFSPGVVVQRGNVDTHVASAIDVPLTPVDLSKSFVLLGGQFNDGSGWGNNEFVRARLTDNHTLNLSTAVAGTQVPWQVVTMDGTTVQRGTASIANADTQGQASIPSSPAGSLVLASYTTDNVSGIAAATMMLEAKMSSSTALAFKRELSGSALDISWEVATLPFKAFEETSTFGAGDLMSSVAIPSLPSDTSVVVASNQAVLGQSSGSTTYAGADLDLLGEAAATLTPIPGAVVAQRLTANASASITWTAIDFSRDRCAM